VDETLLEKKWEELNVKLIPKESTFEKEILKLYIYSPKETDN